MFVKFSSKQMGGISLLLIILFISLAVSNMYLLPSNLEGYSDSYNDTHDNLDIDDKEKTQNLLDDLVDTTIKDDKYVKRLTYKKEQMQKILEPLVDTDDKKKINSLLDKLIDNKTNSLEIYNQIKVKINNIDLLGNVIIGNVIIPK